MRQFDEIDPLTVEHHPNLVAKIPDPSDQSRTIYLLIVDDYVILASTSFHPEFKWLHYQIEFPKQGLQWFLDTMRDKFFKTEAEGGLPKGKFHATTTINGEGLLLGRAFNADGNRGGGYSFATLDRLEDGLAKDYTFTDQLLFKHGLLQIFHDVAAKVAAGQL